jgi:hypothetical protein
MRKSDNVRLGDIYGDILKNVKVVKESKVKSGGNNLSDKVPAPLQDGGPQEKGGWRKPLEDPLCHTPEEDEEHSVCECGDPENCTCHEEEETGKKNNSENEIDMRDNTLIKRAEKLRNIMKKPNLSDKTRKSIQRQIYLLAGTEDEENITESKKVAKGRLNSFMANKKSTFDKLFESVIKENFGMGDDTEDLDALGLDDAPTDDELGDDSGFDDGDTVTFTLDRAAAQNLIEVLQGALGGDDDMDMEGVDDEFGDDLDFEDDDSGMDFDEDEETVGAKDGKGGGAQHPLQGRNNQVGGNLKPRGGSAQHGVTDKVGNDGDHGHAIRGAKKYNDGKSNKVSNIKPGQSLF